MPTLWMRTKAYLVVLLSGMKFFFLAAEYFGIPIEKEHRFWRAIHDTEAKL